MQQVIIIFRNLRIIILTCIFLLFSNSCGGPPSASAAFAAARTLIDLLTILDSASKLYFEYVDKAVSTTKWNLNNASHVGASTTSLSQVTIDWESSWHYVEIQTATLQKRLDEVDDASIKYFDALIKVTDAINDKTLRKQEQAKNDSVAIIWHNAYKRAKESVARARQLSDRGSDFHKVLVVASLRRQIVEYTTTLDSIAEEAQQLIKELETLTIEGRSLINIKT